MDMYRIGLSICICTLMLLVSSNAQYRECSSEPADVVFVLDSSYSIWPPDFYRELTFMKKVIATFDVGLGDDQSRIAAVTFGHGVWPKFYLGTLPAQINRAITTIKYEEGTRTNTGDALKFARDVMLTERGGGRPNATKIIIVVSDGRSQKTFFTQDVAKQLQDEGIILFAVSIGFRQDHKELAGIASDPDNKHYFDMDVYSDLNSVKEKIDATVCGDPYAFTAEFRARDEEVRMLQCNEKQADIFFLVDSSFSITAANFDKEMEFIHSVIAMLDVGQNKTRIGVMSFSDVSKFHVKLNYVMDKSDYFSHLNAVKYMGGGTDTAAALRRMREEGFFDSSAETRDDVAKIAIVLTDGLSLTPDVTAREARLARKMGIQIFSIGIGDGIDKRELSDIASEPTDKFLLHVDDFVSLQNIKKELAVRSCSVEPVAGLRTASDEAVCHPLKPTDLLFVYDSLALKSWKSQSVSQFISKSTTEFNLAADNLRVGREIENCPSGNLPLGSALESDDLNEVRFQSFTDMLNRVNRNRFSEENGGRTNASKMAVVFVDSSQRMNYETFKEAKRLKANVDFFFIVTVGSNTKIQHMTELAGEGNFISVNNYAALMTNTDKLMSAMCDFFFMSAF